MRKYTLIIVFILLGNCGFSQNLTMGSLPSERLFVSTNATSFITGETLHYKLYFWNSETGNKSAISAVAYIELVDSNKKIVSRQKASQTNQTAAGDIFIPSTLTTGNYKLIAYTNWMLNESRQNFSECDVTIINPFTRTDVSKNFINDTLKTKIRQYPPAQEANVFKTNKKAYSTRDKVELELPLLSGNFVLSVRKKSSVFETITKNPKQFLEEFPKNPIAFQHAFSTIPEIRGELISGKITPKSPENVNNRIVALSVLGKNPAFKLVETNAEGKFTFILDQNPGSQDVVVQILDDNRNNLEFTLDKPVEANLSALVFPTEIKIGIQDKESIEQRSIASQIENAYYNLKKDSIQQTAPALPFYNVAEKVYVLDDFTRFLTIRETITEILKEVDYKKTRKGYTVFLRKYMATSAVYGPPLVLVDGLPIFDLNELFDFPAAGIYKVEIVNDPYIYGPKTFSGIIHFITKNNDFELKTNAGYIKKINFTRPSSQKIHWSPDYAANKNSRIPDYRQQLLWIPELQLSGKPQTVSFYTSDTAGEYEIILEGFDSDGKPLYQKDYISVN